MIAQAKSNFMIDSQCYGDQFGISVKMPVLTEQKWQIESHSNGYYFLSRKGGARIRLTDAAFSRMFNKCEAEK